MIEVKLVRTEGCAHCEQVKEILEKLKLEYPDLVVKEILMTTDEGMQLVQKYGIMTSPGVLVNGKLAFTGGATEKQVHKAIDAAKQ